MMTALAQTGPSEDMKEYQSARSFLRKLLPSPLFFAILSSRLGSAQCLAN